MENDKLKQMLKQKDDEVVQTRATLERFANAVSSYAANSLNATPTKCLLAGAFSLQAILWILLHFSLAAVTNKTTHKPNRIQQTFSLCTLCHSFLSTPCDRPVSYTTNPYSPHPLYFVLNSFKKVSLTKKKETSSTKNFKPACRSRALSFFRSRSLKFFPIIQKQKKHHNWTTVNTKPIVYRYYST